MSGNPSKIPVSLGNYLTVTFGKKITGYEPSSMSLYQVPCRPPCRQSCVAPPWGEPGCEGKEEGKQRPVGEKGKECRPLVSPLDPTLQAANNSGQAGTGTV